MRKLFISLSILLFTLSGIITVKALVIPVRNAPHQNNPEGLRSKDISHESAGISEQTSPKEAVDAKNRRVEVKLIPENKEL